MFNWVVVIPRWMWMNDVTNVTNSYSQSVWNAWLANELGVNKTAYQREQHGVESRTACMRGVLRAGHLR